MILEKIKNNKKPILISIAILFPIIIFSIINKPKEMPPLVKVVEVEEITKKDIHQTISLIGKIRAKLSASLTARAPGIFNILIPAGTKVTKDTVIAKINSIEVERRYILTNSAEIIAKEQYERAKNLFKSGAYSKADMESVLNKWISTQKELTDAKLAFEKLQIIAPFDGIIGTYKIQEGAQINGNEAVVSFYDPTNVSLDFDIPASALQYIENGQNVTVNSKNYKLKNVQKMLEDDKHMSPASVDIICEKCIIGDNLDLELNLVSKYDVIVIPFNAIVIRAGNPYVYVVKDNKIELRQVEYGIRQKNLVEIKSGLEVGEIIVSRSVNRLTPGAKVKIANQKNGANH